jgi:hypothetical protein
MTLKKIINVKVTTESELSGYRPDKDENMELAVTPDMDDSIKFVLDKKGEYRHYYNDGNDEVYMTFSPREVELFIKDQTPEKKGKSR